MGCAGGVNGLATAARLAAAEPGTRWLFVTIETCSIAIRLDSDDPAAIVATAIFGDGAAAAVVADGRRRASRPSPAPASGCGPTRSDIMGWRVEDPGLAVVFDRAIPPFIEAELAGAVDGMLGWHGLEPRRHRPLLLPSRRGQGDRRDRKPRWRLPVGTLDLERDVLNDCGNMSAPTVLFVLERLIARGLPERTY